MHDANETIVPDDIGDSPKTGVNVSSPSLERSSTMRTGPSTAVLERFRQSVLRKLDRISTQPWEPNRNNDGSARCVPAHANDDEYVSCKVADKPSHDASTSSPQHSQPLMAKVRAWLPGSRAPPNARRFSTQDTTDKQKPAAHAKGMTVGSVEHQSRASHEPLLDNNTTTVSAKH